MDFRSCINALKSKGKLVECDDELDLNLEVTKKIESLHPQPILFNKTPYMKIATNIFSNRFSYAEFLNIGTTHFLKNLHERLHHGKTDLELLNKTYGEVEMHRPDLSQLPILTHYSGDGGPYITSAVWFVNDAKRGRNLSYHRMMIVDKQHGVVRVVENRGMHQALLNSGGSVDVAICIGPPPAVLLAAACSPDSSVDEVQLAACLDKLTLVKCKTSDLYVPKDCEIVIEGKLVSEMRNEGPFVDITGTWDEIRMQPVFVCSRISHRINPIYHALVPAKSEHCMLMGMPKELDIYLAVNEKCPCLDVRITDGGSSWLHAVVQIEKRHDADAIMAIEAAFQAHKSLKHCVVVDSDIDIYNMNEVEWAIATRFQADKDIVLLTEQPSSSLDPSAFHVPGKKSTGSKLGIDATIKSRYVNRDMFKKIS